MKEENNKSVDSISACSIKSDASLYKHYEIEKEKNYRESMLKQENSNQKNRQKNPISNFYSDASSHNLFYDELTVEMSKKPHINNQVILDKSTLQQLSELSKSHHKPHGTSPNVRSEITPNNLNSKTTNENSSGFQAPINLNKTNFKKISQNVINHLDKKKTSNEKEKKIVQECQDSKTKYLFIFLLFKNFFTIDTFLRILVITVDIMLIRYYLKYIQITNDYIELKSKDPFNMFHYDTNRHDYDHLTHINQYYLAWTRSSKTMKFYFESIKLLSGIQLTMCFYIMVHSFVMIPNLRFKVLTIYSFYFKSVRKLLPVYFLMIFITLIFAVTFWVSFGSQISVFKTL